MQPDTALYQIESGLLSVSYQPDGAVVPRANRTGAPFSLTYTLDIPGALTGNDPVFAMRNRASGGNGRTGFLKRIRATYNYMSAAAAGKGLGFYFQKFDTAAFTGGASLVAIDPQAATTDFTDIRYVAAGTALTIGSAAYINGIFAQSHVGYGVVQPAPVVKEWVSAAPNGIPFSPGQGLVMRVGGSSVLVGAASSVCNVTFEIDWLEGSAT